MERQKFRIKRKNTQFYGTPTCSTTGTTGLWPLNLSLPSVSGQSNACDNVIMYTSLGSQVVNAINGDMTTFPDELKECSMTNPCAILWDVISPPFNDPTQCRNGDGDAWVKFKGLTYWSAGTPTIGTYNELIDIYQIYNADPTINILGQLGGWFAPILTGCFCENTFTGQDLSAVDVFLTQDFNDIGHYSIWDGNISQKDVFSNFLFTSFTPFNVQVFNTTDFEFYKNLPQQFTITWGDGNTSNLVGGNLTAVNTYPLGVYATYICTITQQTPWGPQSTSKAITVPNLSYMNLLGQPYTPTGAGVPGYGTGGLQAAQNQTTLTGPQLYNNANLPNGIFIGSATTYFGAYGVEGTPDYLPLDTGTSILQYTAMSPTACFEVSGITESSLGAFQIYSSAPSNDPNLAPGYFINTPTPIGGDVENPLTNQLENQLIGQIFVATTTYTGYTIESAAVGSNTTPIDFYDFRNGITIFVAQSCGLNANSFGGGHCYTCPIEPCIYCEEKDEYIDRTTTGPTAGQAVLIEFNSATNTNYAAQGISWSPNTDYLEGDIVFDVTSNICCCYMAVKDINQSNPVFSSAWVGVPPALTNNGVWTDPLLGGLGEVHIWEPCCYYPDCDCAPCPTGTLVPCNDPTLPAIWGGPNSNNGGVWQNGWNYTTGQFIADTHGNCYKALQNGLLGEPTGATGSVEWEYTGCISWICPTDPINLPLYGCEPLTGSSVTVINSYFPSPGMVFVGNAFYDSCIQDFNDGLCPYPERWVCDDQYSCGTCIPIYPGQTSPMGYPYNFGGYPFSFVFSSQTDCNNWCNPPLYSCATPTYPCCSTIACNNQAQYFAITNMIPDGMSASDVLLNYGLYQAPTYNLTDCQNTCCELTYQWNCEGMWVLGVLEGCVATPFAVIPPNALGVGPVGGPQTLSDCQALNNGGAAGINQVPPLACGWSCTTPTAVYNPMPADPFGLGYYSSPCTPCYTSNCAPFPDEISCVTGCTDPSTCYICDCSTNTGYQSFTPCPTPTTIGSNIFGSNNGVASGPASPVYGSAYDNALSYATPAAAIAAECCDFGWDCWIINDPNDPNNGQPTGDGCVYYANWTSIPPSLTASTNGPYSSHTECCEETSCCYAECDWQIALTTTYSNNVQPWGFYPCVYMSALTSNFATCHPANPMPASPSNPYCTILDCYTVENPTDNMDERCEDDAASCVCCSAYTWTQYGLTVPLLDRGVFIYPGIGYQIYDTVSHFDADTKECCFVCMCPSLGAGAPGVLGVLDCDGFIPDDGPAPTGQPNCWENCTYQPTNIAYPILVTYDSDGYVINVSPEHCPACEAYSAQTYECTLDGCIASPCVINGAFSMTSQNCYDNINCVGLSGQHECDAGCYCEEGPGGSPATPWSQTGCVVLQDWLNQTDNIYTGGYPSYPGFVPAAGYPNNILPFPMGTYPFATLNVCLTMISGGLDCCDDPRYFCDHIWQCEQPLPAGQGCQPIYPGDPNYAIAPFTDLATCQVYCRWECDNQGLGQCQFVPNSIAAIFFLSGPACQLAYANCDCKPVVPDEWWCDWSGFIGTTPLSSNCILVTGGATPPNPLNSYGIDPMTLQPCLWGTAGCYSFGSQPLCEAYCRFCCDVAPPGTSFCQLDWFNQQCDVSLYDCTQTSIILYGSYPCYDSPDVEFCCDDTLGCISYTGPMPPGCVYGPYTNMAGCQSECNFLCDDCVPTCECIFVGALPGGCGLATPYSSITQCETAISVMIPPVIYGDNGCCDCWECHTQGGVYYEIQDAMGFWVGVTQTVNLATLPAQPWVSGQMYSIGDVVLAGAQDGADPTCCYVLVYDNINWSMHPATAYANYLAAYNNNLQTQYTWAWWIPCDIDCPEGGPVTGWECEPGYWDYSCISKQIKLGDGVATCCADCAGGGGGWSLSIPGVGPGRCKATYPRETLSLLTDPLNNIGAPFFCVDLNVTISPIYNASMDIRFRKYEMPNTDGTPGGFNNVSGCCEGCNLLDDPNDYGGPDAGCLYGINYFQVVGAVDYIDSMSGNYCVGLTANFHKWTDFVSALNVCGIHPGGTPWDATAGPAPPYNIWFDDVETYLNTDPLWVADDSWLYIDWTYCFCVDRPCSCYEITGSTGTYPSESACEQDCCQYYECTDDPNTGAPCTCVPLPIGQVGPYPTLTACTNDPLSCCNTYCDDCVGTVGHSVVKQEFDGIYNPYQIQSSASATVGNSAGNITPWFPNTIWDYNEVTVSPKDGCCYISNQHMGEQVHPYSSYDPAICYDMFLVGLACDGSDIGSPTSVTTAQNDMCPWWPCDPDCAGLEPSGSGSCLKCCEKNGSNGTITIMLLPSANPCKCPQGWSTVPIGDCGPVISGAQL
mgnify:CR=1 FL=1|tara:strand:- start:23209 stop:30240 length:7032 start_codon:yes stop_codon:yes gene_type:complete